jgi:multidrug efflux pump subunit AcrB
MKEKGFKLTNISVDNKTTIYFAVVFLVIFGILQYYSTPKESMPEIDIPFMIVTTIYPGTSPTDMENLITRPIEKELKGISGIKEINSQSLQDYSMIFIEFETGTDDTQSYLDVKEGVDEARSELPNDLDKDPEVIKIEFSEFPILNINLSGDLSLVKLKELADDLKDEIESLEEVTRVDIVGALDREIQINIDIYKMQTAGLTFTKIRDAVANENLTITSGLIETDGVKNNLRVVGEFDRVEQIRNILLQEGIYLKDIAQVVDGFEDRKSYARLNESNVITLNVIKKGGKNIIYAVDKIKEIIRDFKEEAPENLTGDNSKYIRNNVSNLFNTIVIGFLVVIIVLMFFMGIDNALFAGLAIPLSIVIAFIFVPVIGFTINNVVLMGFILVLGILVDNSIVVVENIYRHYTTTENLPIIPATKRAVGEVAIPVLTGCLTTMAPFLPLMFWPGIIGKFMNYIPIVINITLAASLLVAYTMNPVFAVSFMKYEGERKAKRKNKKIIIISLILLIAAVPFYLLDIMLIGNLVTIGLAIYLFGIYALKPLIKGFQSRILPRFVSFYKNMVSAVLEGKRPYVLFAIIIVFLIFSFILFSIKTPRVILFVQGDPNSINVYITMPEGTHVDVTNSIAKIVEERVYEILGRNNPNVESIITNIAVNAGSGIFRRSSQDKLARITIQFVEYKDRTGDKSTRDYLNELRKKLVGIPGAKIIVDARMMGPPTEKPINIEISGEDIDKLIAISERLYEYINSLNIEGIEQLESDMDLSKPEIILKINRDKANQLGVNTSKIGSMLRTAIYGNEVSKFREGDDEYPIMARLDKKYRNNIGVLLSQKIEGKGGNPAGMIPLSAVASVEYRSTYGGIIHKDNKRVITLSSNILSGYNAREVVSKIQNSLKDFESEAGYTINFTGELEQQAENARFIVQALFVALGLIMIILVTQFNSIGKPLIILTQIFFSFIGIFLGLVIFNIDFSIVMSGLAIVAVGGVVATNGIILISYMDNRMALGGDSKTAVVTGAATRLIPVILTAASTILGLLPLAVGINIDFVTLFTQLNPHIYFGGDAVDFWNPLAWAIIFGLSFATFLTLIIEPAMYYTIYGRRKERKKIVME